MSKKILVLGATGEIGGRIARLAVDAGHQVCGVSRGLNHREQVDLTGVEMLIGNKSDETFVRDKLAKMDIDVLIDSVPNIKNIESYSKYLKQVKNFFFCSSTGTFVPLQYFPADEKHPWRDETAVNFYSQSVRDAYILELWKKEKFPGTIFRPTNIIGQGRVPLELWGARDIEFFRKLKRAETITIAPCEHIMVQSGYNWDLASAFVKAIDQPEAVRGEIFIISCKHAITLGQYLQTAIDFLGSKSNIEHCPAEKLKDIYPEVTMKFRMDFLLQPMCLDISKAEKTFGYAPTRTTQEGLIEALQWCKNTGLL
ncbi:MAG: NAD(P)-dependent oxidoreductase [Victivallaceae bacterium]|nr:NAD(P)-dependent oxidoreductase [Victivallaceae bacterium]MDD4180692.1 NAD(P)-dependent oxidoreductase [Victivallaceae bacterium]